MLVSVFDGFCSQLRTAECCKIELSLWRRCIFTCFCCLLLGWLLEANMAPTWFQLEPKIHPNSFQNGFKSHPKINAKIDQIFDCFLDAFLPDFVRFCLPTFPNLTDFQRFLVHFWKIFWEHLQVLLALGAKMAPRPPQEGFRDRFQFPFGSIWGHMGVDLGSIF